MRLKGPAIELPLGQSEYRAKEPKHSIRCIRIECQSARGSMLKIIEMALTSCPDVGSSNLSTIQDALA
jgi:hypothetical protein